MENLCLGHLKISYCINTFFINIFFTMSNLVARVKTLLLQESLDALCGVSVVYLIIENNTLPPYNDVREIVDRAVTSSLTKIKDLGRRTKVLEILLQVGHKWDFYFYFFTLMMTL